MSYAFRFSCALLLTLSLLLQSPGLQAHPLIAPAPATTIAPTAQPNPTDTPALMPTTTLTRTSTVDRATPTPQTTGTPEVPTPTQNPTATITPTITATPDTDTIVISPATGGAWRSADGSLTLAVPPGAVTTVAYLHVAAQDDLATALPDLPLRFSFTVQDAATDAAVTELAVPAVLTWRVGADSSDAAASYRLWRVEVDQQAMFAVDHAASDATGLTASLVMPGVYAVTSTPTQDVFFPPRIQAGQVDAFTGDANFTYDFDAPAGAGGVKPALQLRYSSGGPNLSGWGSIADGGWVGAGWTLDIGEIALTQGDEGTLTLGSLSSKIKLTDKLSQVADTWQEEDMDPGCTYTGDPALDSNAGRTHAKWRALNEQFARIESNRFSSNSSTGCGQISNLLYAGNFDLWAKDGTHYVFGNDPVTYTPQACGVAEQGSGSRQAYWDGYWTRRYSVYKLDTVTDPHGNTLRIEYDVKIRHPDCVLRAFREAYPKRILYTTNPAAGDNLAEYEIEFVTSPKDVDPKPEPLISNTGWKLDAIVLFYRPSIGAPLQRIRKYTFSYVNYDSPQMYLLQSIQQFGNNDTSTLPATTFTYFFDDSHQVGWKSSSNYEACGWSFHERRAFLQSINNGYDGQVQYDYSVQCLPDGYAGCTGSDVGDGMLQKVARRTVNATVGGPAQVTEYQHFSPSYHRILDCSWDDLTKNKEFIGYGRVIEDAKGEDGQILRRTETIFHNAWTGATANPKDPLRGKAYQTTTGAWNGAAWQERQITSTSWATITSTVLLGGGAVPWPADIAFTYPAQVTTTEVEADSSSWSRKTKNYYDVGWQDACNAQGGQYGNLTRVEEYGQVDSATPYRTTVTGYCPNTSAYIVDRPAFQNLYAGAGPTQPGPTGFTLLASTISSYSDDPANPSPNWQTPVGSKGELRGTRRWAFTDGEARYVDTRNWHDAFGNVTDQTEYTDYGATDAWAATPRAKVHFDYDATHHTFKTLEQRITLSGSLPVTQVTAYYYYGVNGAATGSGLPGQLQHVIAPNNAETWQTYDVFGRLLQQWQPYDSAAMPTVSYEYLDSYPGATTAVHKWEQELPGIAGSRLTITFYDGLGRVVQTKVESADDAEMVITDQTYDALGRVQDAYVPYKENDPTYFNAYRPVNPVQPKTTYTYDARDRTLSVTQPDGTTTATAYRICLNANDSDFIFPRLCQEVTDANNHMVRYASDALGRLRSVTQWNGATEVRSRYEYDAADHLLSAQDPGLATAAMTYDQLGRKLTLSDPDMGGWQYRYDAAGNLVGQRDAEHQATCLYYDAFNRLTSKRYAAGVVDLNAYLSSGTCPANAQQDASYSYDAGAHGQGRRTGMVDSSGSTSWTYDARGRVTVEAKAVTGSGAFRTEWLYDSLDRVTWQKYPGGNNGQVGEQVDYTYRPVGALRAVIGATIYVTNTQYNALGQVTSRDLGVGRPFRQSYSYPQSTNYRLATLQSSITPKSILQSHSYSYDNVGNLLTIQDAAAYGGVQTQTFSYDALDRLSTAVASGGAGACGLQSYGYADNGNLTTFAGVSQAYNDPAHPHAVTHLNNTEQYGYDPNGNATLRKTLEGGTPYTYTLTYDFENRLTELRKNGAVLSLFQYDGDGQRVTETTGGVTTVYIGDYYEWTGSPATMKSYYAAGGTRVALRTGTNPGTLNYLLTDQLGSTAITLDQDRKRLVPNVELRYYPYGAQRYTSGDTPTSFRFTGQRQQTNANELYFYNSRWYDPLVGRFLSADTIVPDPYNPQGLNRYTYVGNSPLKYTDPSGHSPQYPGCGMSMPDCGVDGWFGVSDYDRYIQPERDQTAKAMVVAVSRLVDLVDSVMTVRDCLAEGCNVPLAALAIMSPLPGSVSKYLRHIDDNAFRKLLALGARNGDEVKAILGNAGTDALVRGMVDASGNQILLRAGDRKGGLRHIIGGHLTGELADQGDSFFDDSLKVGDVVDIVAETIRNGQRSRAANGRWVYRWQHKTWGWITTIVNEAGEVVSAYPD